MASTNRTDLDRLRPLGGPLSLSEAVAARLREAILGGALAPGTRLVERDIAAQLGISRMPVREAIQQLVDQGLLVKEPRRGAYVHPYSALELEEIASLRVVMERLVVERALPRWTPQVAQRLEEIVAAMRQAAGVGDFYQVYQLDEHFHAVLWKLADHRLLLEILTGLRARISRFLLEATLPLPPHELQAHVETHQELLEVLRRGDLAAALAAVEYHVGLATRRIREHYRYLHQPAGSEPHAAAAGVTDGSGSQC